LIIKERLKDTRNQEKPEKLEHKEKPEKSNKENPEKARAQGKLKKPSTRKNPRNMNSKKRIQGKGCAREGSAGATSDGSGVPLNTRAALEQTVNHFITRSANLSPRLGRRARHKEIDCREAHDSCPCDDNDASRCGAESLERAVGSRIADRRSSRRRIAGTSVGGASRCQIWFPRRRQLRSDVSRRAEPTEHIP